LLTWSLVSWYLTALQSQIKKALAKNIAKTVLPLGLPMTSLPAFKGALALGNEAALVKIPGVSLQILGAAVLELKQTYAATFRLDSLSPESPGE
jgi:Holliday junction resolvasome RuvABC DNA-binding subunit